MIQSQRSPSDLDIFNPFCAFIVYGSVVLLVLLLKEIDFNNTALSSYGPSPPFLSQSHTTGVFRVSKSVVLQVVNLLMTTKTVVFKT